MLASGIRILFTFFLLVSSSALRNPTSPKLDGQAVYETFEKDEKDGDGKLDRNELREALKELVGGNGDKNIRMENVLRLIDTFDTDGDREIDFYEFDILARYLQGETRVGKKSVVTQDIMNELEGLKRGGRGLSGKIDNAISNAKSDRQQLLMQVAKDIYPFRNLLCVQHEEGCEEGPVDFQKVMDDNGIVLTDDDSSDKDFESAFSPSSMRCLALVSHNGMKPSMREFVTANKNLLKKFRLTGTNSTINMLKEVFADEPEGTVVYGPACESGPLGGDAEMVGLITAGRVGGMIFFRDPMSAHPHRVDIDCLLRQAVVHNTMVAYNPTTAFMMTHTLREALKENKPQMIPSFFFSLECPAVGAYKAQQKKVVDEQKEAAREENEKS